VAIRALSEALHIPADLLLRQPEAVYSVTKKTNRNARVNRTTKPSRLRRGKSANALSKP
jgi:hypothetical protein